MQGLDINTEKKKETGGENMGKKQNWYYVLWVHEFSDRGQTMSSRPVLQTPVPRTCRDKCAQEQGLNVVSTTGLL